MFRGEDIREEIDDKFVLCVRYKYFDESEEDVKSEEIENASECEESEEEQNMKKAKNT